MPASTTTGTRSRSGFAAGLVSTRNRTDWARDGARRASCSSPPGDGGAGMQLTSRVALAGAADTAVFLARRPEMFRDNRGRAVGSAAFGSLWLALAVSSAAQRPRPGTATTALAGAVAAGNAAMLAIHLRQGRQPAGVRRGRPQRRGPRRRAAPPL